jgi:hypothetical protein
VGFEPIVSVFDREKAFHASDCAATVIGRKILVLERKLKMKLAFREKFVHRLYFPCTCYFSNNPNVSSVSMNKKGSKEREREL